MLGQLVVAVPAAPTEVGGGAVGGDPVHPGGELGVATEARQPPVGPEVGLLGHVTGVLLVAGQAQREGVGVAVGVGDQLLEGRDVAGPRPVDEGAQRIAVGVAPSGRRRRRHGGERRHQAQRGRR